jgi:hypothetical protein
MAEFWRILPRTRGFMIAIQDQVICNNNYKKYIFKDLNTTNNICRKFREGLETIKHITGTCRALTCDLNHCHNQIAGVIHQELAIICGLSRGKPTICVRELIYYTVP